MPYIKQGFTKGQTLKADHLNYIEDGIANHAHSYNNLTDRTHYAEFGKTNTLTWNGDLSNKEYVELEPNLFAVKLADYTIASVEDTIGGTIISSMEEIMTITEDDIYEISENIMGIMNLMIISEDTALYGITLTKGIWTLYEIESEYYAKSITFENAIFTGEIVYQLDEKFIPDTITRTNHKHSYNDLTNRTHYAEGKTIDERRHFTNENNYTIIDLEFAKLLVEYCEIATYMFHTDKTTNDAEFVSISDNGDDKTIYTDAIITSCPIHVNLSTGEVKIIDSDFDSCSIMIYKYEETVVQLDEKFIPDSIARVSDIPEQVRKVQSDWDEEDETSPAFILNKPTSLGGNKGGFVYYAINDYMGYGCLIYSVTEDFRYPANKDDYRVIHKEEFEDAYYNKQIMLKTTTSDIFYPCISYGYSEPLHGDLYVYYLDLSNSSIKEKSIYLPPATTTATTTTNTTTTEV